MCEIKVAQIPSSRAIRQKIYHSKLKLYTVLSSSCKAKVSFPDCHYPEIATLNLWHLCPLEMILVLINYNPLASEVHTLSDIYAHILIKRQDLEKYLTKKCYSCQG